MMDKKVRRYYQLKQKSKEIELELSNLRQEILAYCKEQGVAELTVGGFKVKIVFQDRKEYDDNKLYDALPDPKVWHMVSKSDPAKITNLLKLNVLSEEGLKHTYSIKTIAILQVDKK